MNINAKQLTSIDIHRMDNTTSLGFFIQMRELINANAALKTALSTVWKAYTAALGAYDEAYAQSRRWAQTADITELDAQRDAALSAFLQALKAMTASPNAQKQQAAKLLQFIRDKYTLSASDEYMKETTAISQMVQEMEASSDATAALTTTGLDDWLTDLKQKNQAFLQKMNERTAEQAGQEKGIVREKRLLCEAAYRNLVKLINAAAIMEIPADLDFTAAINLLNAEVDHYRTILARKGGSSSSTSGSSSTTGGGSTSDDAENGGTGTGGSSTGGSGSGNNDDDDGPGDGTEDGTINTGGGSGSGSGGSSDGDDDGPGDGGE